MRIVLRGREHVVRQRLVLARLPTLDRVDTRVEDEPVQPGRELRVAAELLQPDAHFRERLLRGIARIFGIAKDVAREPLDLRGVTSKERSSAARRRPSLA